MGSATQQQDQAIAKMDDLIKKLGAIDGSTVTSCTVPCVANGVLFTVHGKWLWAVCDKGEQKQSAKLQK